MRKKIIQILILIFCMSQNAFAQNQITITPTLLSPYSPYFSDYLVYENKTTIILTAPNAIGKRVFLRGTITGDNGISISTKAGYKPAVPLTISTPTVILKGIDLEEYFNWENVNVYGIDLPKVAQGDGLPEGTYTICLRAFDYDNGVALSADAPTGCVTISIKNVEPPIINLPKCGSAIVPNPTQTIVFSWNPPPGAPPLCRYLIKMAEMPVGMDNYNHALNTLTSPAFFEKEIITSNYTYTLADAPLQVGKTYAFKVVAFDPNNKINFRNGGESEVCYFTYGVSDKPTETTATTPSKKNKVKFTSYSGAIPTTKIKGKLTWAFHKDEEGDDKKIDNTQPPIAAANADGGSSSGGGIQSYGNFVVKTDATFAAAVTAANGGAIAQPATPTANTNGIAKVVNGIISGVIPNMLVAKTMQQKKSGQLRAMAGKQKFAYANKTVKIYLGMAMATGGYIDKNVTKSAAPTSTSSQPKNGMSVFASNVTTKSAAAISQPALGTKDNFGRVLIGVTTTNEDGEFSIDVINKDLWKNGDKPIISLEFDSKNFIFATQSIEIQTNKTEELDLGEHIGIAKTFRLKLKVKSKATNQQDKGNPLNDATVKILRKNEFYNAYPLLKKEVNAFNGNTTTEDGYEVVGQGKAGSNFLRLFYQTGLGEDKYYIKVEMKDYTMLTQAFSVKDEYPYNNDAFTKDVTFSIDQAEQTIELKAPTFIKGQLVTRGSEVPIKNTKVELVGTTNNSNFEELANWCITDSTGKFSFNDILPNGQIIYRLKINDHILGTIYPSVKDGNVQDPQNIILANYGDRREYNPLYINGNLITVKGTVKNIQKEIVSNAILRWKSGGQSFNSGTDGSFVTTMVKGKHKLLVTKNGYRETEVEVDVVEANATNTKSKNDLRNGITTGGWTNAVSTSTATGTSKTDNKNSTATASSMQMASNFGYSNVASFSSAVLGDKAYLNQGTVQNIGDVIIKRFYVNVKVTDATNKSTISNAEVKDKNADDYVTANAQGFVILDNVTGTSPTINVKGPINSLYIPKEVLFDLKADKDTAIVEVELEKGTAITGKVLSSGNGVKDAKVYVEGMEYINAITDASGNYSIATKQGEYTVIATKQGLQGDKKIVQVGSNAVTQNFNLVDAGFDASTLLGFAIELIENKPGANANEKIISGAFIKIPGNTLFSLPNNYKIPFNNQKIKIVNGKPEADSIVTTVTQMEFDLFDYMPLKLENTKGIVIKKQGTAADVGGIYGAAILNTNKLLNKVTGLSIPVDASIALSGTGANKKEITAFISNGALPLDGNNLKLIGLNDNNNEWEIYSTKIKIDFGKSFILKNGIQLGGVVKMNNYPIIGSKTFNINKFFVNTGGDVQFDVACNINEQLEFASWKLRVGEIKVNNYGVTASGAVDMTLPETDKISVSFNQLKFTTSGISGGSFNIYSQFIANQIKTLQDAVAKAQNEYNNLVQTANNAQSTAMDQARNAVNSAKASMQNKLDQLLSTAKNEINLFKIISYAPGTVPFSLGKIPGGNNYKLQGSGTFGLKEYINDKIKLSYFSIATDGNFAFNTELNVKQNFMGLADLEINEFGLNTQRKSLTVGGKLFLKIPGFGIGAGTTITYYSSGKVDLSAISFKMDIGPVGTFAGGLSLKPNGFGGNGEFKVVNSFGLGASFLYEKEDAGFKFGVDFTIRPAPFIPVGVVNIIVSGGGFEINTNPGKESVMVKVFGGLSLAVDPQGTAAAIDPLEVRVAIGSGGPILEGIGTIKIARMDLGKGGFKLDIPNKYFTAYAELGKSVNIIPSLPLKAEAGARVSASLQKGKEYFMFGMYTEVNIINICKSNTNIIMAWGMPKVQGTEEDRYAAFIADDYLFNGKIFGFGFESRNFFGVRPENAVEFSIPIVSAKGYYYNESNITVFGNFKSNMYGFGIQTKFEAGAEFRAFGYKIGGGGFGIGGYIKGACGNNNWFFEANLNANVWGDVGGCDPGCYIGGCWFGLHVCANGSVWMKLSKNAGFQYNISLK